MQLLDGSRIVGEHKFNVTPRPEPGGSGGWLMALVAAASAAFAADNPVFVLVPCGRDHRDSCGPH